MEIPQSNKGSAWEEADEAQAKSHLAQFSNEVLWSIFQRAAQFEPLDPEIVWDDPLLLHRGEVERIRHFIKDIKASLRKLGMVSDALESFGAKYREDYLDHLYTEFDDHDAYIRARPFSECLRCWTEGYSNNRQTYVADNGLTKSKSWRNYLEEAAKPIRKTRAKKSADDNQLEFYTLRREFLKRYEENRNHRGLFRDANGNLIPRPSSGPRPNGPIHEEKEVELWVCDSQSPYGHKYEYSKKPNSEFEFEVTTITNGQQQLGGYALMATIYDRYFCPDYESCGGVLVPQFGKNPIQTH
jgi:hypothetical protein